MIWFRSANSHTGPKRLQHAIAVALQAQPIAVVLDFVKPIRCVPRRDAKIKRPEAHPEPTLRGQPLAGGESLVTPQTKCELHRGTII